MVRIRARACAKCKEYAIIHVSDPNNQNYLRLFDQKHRGHTVVTLDLTEVKGVYNSFAAPESS